MTTKEAIKVIESLMGLNDERPTDAEQLAALDLATEALRYYRKPETLHARCIKADPLRKVEVGKDYHLYSTDHGKKYVVGGNTNGLFIFAKERLTELFEIIADKGGKDD